MLQAYIVTYDICDPKRLRKVFKTLQGYGEHLQLSVFRCELDPMRLVRLRQKLSEAIHHTQDQVLIVDMGPADGRGRGAVESIGIAYEPPKQGALIV
jgi:CRISPR-associated protein Cas2